MAFLMTTGTYRGQTIFLTGPLTAGKTTTALLWSIQQSERRIALDWDLIAGILLVGDELRGHHFADTSSRYQFAAKVAAAKADQLTAAGFDCMIAGARTPASPTDPPDWLHMWDDLDRLDPITVVLLPSLEVCLARGRSRHGPHAVSDEHVRASHGRAWSSWREDPRAIVLDTTDLSQQAAVAELEHAVSKLSDPNRSQR